MFRPVLISPPSQTPVTLEEVKAQAVVDFGDDDALLTTLLEAAVSHLDGFAGVLGRAMVTQTWRVQHSRWSRDIHLPVPDVSAVAITYADTDGDEQTVAPEHIRIYPTATGTMVQIRSAFDLPALEADNIAPISLDFTCGFGGASDVPAALKLAVKSLAAAWYEDRTQASPIAVSSLIQPYRWTKV
jgi:uncharacterized phiE125 gp8 family phage protein